MNRSLLAKAERRLATYAASPADSLVFLVLSGSFNPVHTQHVRALELARSECERRGWPVIGGFLVPSSQQYVQTKLDDAAWPFARRVDLCERATSDSDWIEVWPTGHLSGRRAANEIRQRLSSECASLGARTVRGVEVMGSDTAIRIFDKMAEDWQQETGGVGKAWYDQRVVCCLIRPGPTSAHEAEHVRRVTAPAIAPVGIQIELVDLSSGSLQDISSADMRELIAARDWRSLLARGYLHPRVCDALEATSAHE